MILINGARLRFEDQLLATAMADMGYRNLHDPSLRISINEHKVALSAVETTHLTDGDRIDITRIPNREFYL